MCEFNKCLLDTCLFCRRTREFRIYYDIIVEYEENVDLMKIKGVCTVCYRKQFIAISDSVLSNIWSKGVKPIQPTPEQLMNQHQNITNSPDRLW